MQQQQYERPVRSDSMHFITLITNIRGRWFVDEHDCRTILAAFEGERQRLGLECLGYVLLPDRIHALLYQHGSGPMVRQFVQDFKQATAHKLHGSEYPGRTLWRMRFENEPVPDAETAMAKITYMHQQPVLDGLAERPEDYPWSSAHQPAGLVSVTSLQ